MSNKPDFNWFNLEFSKALKETVDKTVSYSERRTRREYSILFHTPLHTVYTLDFSFILQNLYEYNLQNKTKQQLALIIADFIPEVGQAIEDDNQEFMRQIEASIKEKNRKKLENQKNTDKKQSDEKESEVNPPEINLSFQDEDPDLL